MKTTEWKYKPGVNTKLAHTMPHMVLLRSVALASAPDTTDGIMWITEAHRPPRHTDDAHTWCNAFDFRIHNIEADGIRAQIAEAWEWVKRQRAVLKDQRYQFDVHGATDAQKHIHAEFDPR